MKQTLHPYLPKITILFLFILFSIHTKASTDDENNNGKITGFVKTSDNKPAPFVNVSIKGLNKTTTTIDDGSFIFNNIKPGTYTLKASHTGTKTEEKTVTVTANHTTHVDFVLTESSTDLNEVVVSSTKTINRKNLTIGKTNIPPIDLPQSVSTIGRDVLDQQQSLRLSDVIKNVNGVYLYSSRGNTQETFAARGYNFSSTNMFKNGFRINSGVVPEISSLERVEILKGSAALLYGNVAPGGVLNLVTKKPKFDFGGQASMTIGSYDLYKPVFDVYGPISSKLAFRLNGTYEKANSYRDNVKSERFYVNPSLLYKISDKTNIIVEGDYLNYDFTPDFGTGQVNNVIANVPRNRYLSAIWSTGNTKQTTATATINHQINSLWQLSGGFSYQHFDRQYQTTERVLPDAKGDWARTLNQAKTLEDYFTAQFNVTGQFNTGFLKHNVLVGADADWYRNDSYTYVATVGGKSSYWDGTSLQSAIYDTINIFDLSKYTQRTDKPTMDPFYHILTPTNRAGVYANDLISISDKLKVLAGLRWSYQYISPTQVTNFYNPALAIQSKSKEDKAFSPRVGLVYKPLSNTALFASYSNSFVVNTGTDVNNNPLDPSTIDQYEAGIKNDFLNGNLSVNVTAYSIKNNNLAQTAVFQADGVTPNTNTNIKVLSGETRSNGVELDIAGHPVKGLDVLAGYSYTNAKYTKTPNTVGSNIAGQPLLNVPKHTANTSVFYTFYDGSLQGFKLGASIYYLGNRIAGNANTVGQTQTLSRLVYVPGFTTVDASLGYGYKKFSIIGKLSNIGNVLNWNVHENYSINPIPPRQFLTTLTYKF